jgi:hypothetical protein
MSVRTIERWLATGGEPEHHRPSAQCRDAQTPGVEELAPNLRAARWLEPPVRHMRVHPDVLGDGS